jgi:putative NADPH-quinone reductase
VIPDEEGNILKSKRILVVDGHPDARPGRYLHSLAGAYREGAQAAGHEVRMITVARLEFPLLRTAQEFAAKPGNAAVQEAQQALVWADHVVILFPLWLGSMPALLKAFLEQTLRPGFAFAAGTGRGLPRKLLAGRSARIVVTMGMPSLFYRLVYRAHSLKSLERNILGFCGFKPVRASVIGTVEGMKPAARSAWLEQMKQLGRRAV